MTDLTPLYVCLPAILIVIIIYYGNTFKICINSCCRKRETQYIVQEHNMSDSNTIIHNNIYIPIPISLRNNNNGKF